METPNLLDMLDSADPNYEAKKQFLSDAQSKIDKVANQLDQSLENLINNPQATPEEEISILEKIWNNKESYTTKTDTDTLVKLIAEPVHVFYDSNGPGAFLPFIALGVSDQDIYGGINSANHKQKPIGSLKGKTPLDYITKHGMENYSGASHDQSFIMTEKYKEIIEENFSGITVEQLRKNAEQKLFSLDLVSNEQYLHPSVEIAFMVQTIYEGIKQNINLFTQMNYFAPQFVGLERLASVCANRLHMLDNWAENTPYFLHVFRQQNYPENVLSPEELKKYFEAMKVFSKKAHGIASNIMDHAHNGELIKSTLAPFDQTDTFSAISARRQHNQSDEKELDRRKVYELWLNQYRAAYKEDPASGKAFSLMLVATQFRALSLFKHIQSRSGHNHPDVKENIIDYTLATFLSGKNTFTKQADKYREVEGRTKYVDKNGEQKSLGYDIHEVLTFLANSAGNITDILSNQKELNKHAFDKSKLTKAMKKFVTEFMDYDEIVRLVNIELKKDKNPIKFRVRMVSTDFDRMFRCLGAIQKEFGIEMDLEPKHKRAIYRVLERKKIRATEIKKDKMLPMLATAWNACQEEKKGQLAVIVKTLSEHLARQL